MKLAISLCGFALLSMAMYDKWKKDEDPDNFTCLFIILAAIWGI